MRKIIIFVLLLTSIMSCSTTKKVRESKKIIKGAWVLNTITYSEKGKYNVTLLNDVSKECFEGSNWIFTPNNNTGIYNITKNNCALGERNFIFTIKEIDPTNGLYDFLLKPTDKKNKSIDNRGFRLKLAELSDSTMTWVQTINVSGKLFKINMNFTKTIK